MSLRLHTGAYAATEEELRSVITPDHTDTWYPVPHAIVLDQVREVIVQNHMTIRDQALAVFKDGQRMFGYLEVTNGHNQPDYGLVIGLRNSHDRSFPVGLAVGHRVFVCDNLAFSGEVVISHKHTRRVLEKLPEMLSRAMALLTEKRATMEQRIEAYKGYELDDLRCHDLIVRAIDQSVVATSRLPELLQAWRQPPFPEFEPRTTWSLFNAFTQVLKQHPVQDLTQRTLRLHGLCDMMVGLATAESAKAEFESEADEDVSIKVAFPTTA